MLLSMANSLNLEKVDQPLKVSWLACVAGRLATFLFLKSQGGSSLAPAKGEREVFISRSLML